MKICYITPLFTPWSLGGAEKYIEILAKEFSKNNEVFVITSKGPKPRNEKNQDFRIIELKQAYPLDLYSFISTNTSIGKTKKTLWYLNDLWSISIFKQIKLILHNEKPDIIHTNGFQGLSGSLFSAINKSKIPHVHTLHNYELFSHWATMYRKGQAITKFNLLDTLYLTFMRKISSNITAVISPSKFVMDFAQKNGFFDKSKKFVIPHGINSSLKTKPKEHSNNQFLYFGRLDETKGVQIAIKAFKQSPERKIQLHIVGTGPYENDLKILADNDKRIIFHGYLEKENLNFLINQCSYAIVPSIWYEPFGLVIIESFNYGLPVIASKIGAIPEIITHEYNGFLFEPTNTKSLSDIISRTVDNHQLISKLSQNALDSLQHHSLSSVLKSTISIYQSIRK